MGLVLWRPRFHWRLEDHLYTATKILHKNIAKCIIFRIMFYKDLYFNDNLANFKYLTNKTLKTYYFTKPYLVCRIFADLAKTYMFYLFSINNFQHFQ